MRRIAFACWATLVLSTTATAAAGPEPTGRWDREDGLGGIEIAPCGEALCGRVTWLRDSNAPAHVGQLVLFGMKRTAEDTWTGSAENPEDGRIYSGTMTLSGARLLTKGCVLAGLICRSVALNRPR